MEVVIIEAQTFERILAKIETLAGEVKALSEEQTDKVSKKWIPGGEVCRLLNISPRTLQTYRDNGTLPFAQIGYKVFFRPRDIENIINQNRAGYGKQ
jgi:hypothetical protein